MTIIQPTIHGTCVLWRGCGILIIGPSGGGKSQLALTLMAEDENAAELVADDRVVVKVVNQSAIASAPAALSGKIERFGMGIEIHKPCASATIGLVVDLMPRDTIERLPDAASLFWNYELATVPKLILPTQPVSPVASIRTTLHRARR